MIYFPININLNQDLDKSIQKTKPSIHSSIPLFLEKAQYPIQHGNLTKNRKVLEIGNSY